MSENPSAATPELPSERADIPRILPASHWQQAPIEDYGLLEAESENEVEDDKDSAYGSSIQSTDSLTNSIFEYRTLNGRTYNASVGRDAESWNPNDEKHLESMDIFHHVHTLLYDGRLFLSPLKEESVKKALDIGTGTGIWAIDFAEQFPDCEVTGTDLSPVQPAWVTQNVKWEIDDANNIPWTWADNTFDFIHIRNMYGSISDWDALYAEAFRCLKPGGYIEEHEGSTKWECENGTITEDTPLGQWPHVFWEAGKKSGRTFRSIEDRIQETGMRKAGFVDLNLSEYKVPASPWPRDRKMKEMGAFAKMTFDTDAEGWVMYMWSTVLGWSKEEVLVFLAHVRNQLKNPRIRPWNLHRTVYARKP